MPFTEITTEYGEKAEQVAQVVRCFLLEHRVPGFIADMVAGLLGGIVLIGGVLLAVLAASVTNLLVPVATAVVTLIGEVRKDSNNELNQLLASTISEFLGVEIDATNLSSGGTLKANAQRMSELGGVLYETLTGEFGAEQYTSPEQGEKAAHTFTGFAVNFAVQSALISELAEMLSLGQLENFRELGVQVAEALGLGRLQRKALGVLLQEVVQTPYTEALRLRYRPTRMADAQLVRAFHRGAVTEEQLRQELGMKGYRPAYVDHLIVELSQHLTDTQLSRLQRWGDITGDDALAQLKNQGVNVEAARLMFRENDLARAESPMGTYVAKIGQMTLDGFLSIEDYQSLLETTPLADIEKHWEAKLIGIQLEYPRKKLSWSEITTLFTNGQVDFDYVDVWLEAEGYSEEDQLNKIILLLIELKKFVDREKAAEERKARADARKAAGKH